MKFIKKNPLCFSSRW